MAPKGIIHTFIEYTTSKDKTGDRRGRMEKERSRTHIAYAHAHALLCVYTICIYLLNFVGVMLHVADIFSRMSPTCIIYYTSRVFCASAHPKCAYA